MHVANVYKNEVIQTGSALVVIEVTGNSLVISHLIPTNLLFLVVPYVNNICKMIELILGQTKCRPNLDLKLLTLRWYSFISSLPLGHELLRFFHQPGGTVLDYVYLKV